ncbi:MAG: hypothetical protein ACYTFY_19435 [Planctomycetota bacterium]|jgi:hypothetical protein
MSLKSYTFFKIILLCILLQPVISAADKKTDKMSKKGLHEILKQPECEKGVEIIAKAYNSALDSLTYALEKVKKEAEKKDDVDEVIRVKALLNGEGHQSFSSSSAIRAQESFEKKLREAIEKAIPEFKSAISAGYEKNDKESTTTLKKLITDIENNLKVKSYVRKTGKLSANVQHMKSGIFVKEGSKIEVRASGKWRPGGWKGKKGRTHNPEYGDADTYNIALAIDGKYIGKGGKKWEATAKKSGELVFQMAGHNARKGGAAGYQTLQLTVITSAILREQMAFAENCLKISGLEKEEKKESKNTSAKSSGKTSEKEESKVDTGGPVKIADMEKCSNICKFIFSRRKSKKSLGSWLWNNFSKDTQNLVLDISLHSAEYPTEQHKKIIAKALNDIIKKEGESAEKKIMYLLKKGKEKKGRKKRK